MRGVKTKLIKLDKRILIPTQILFLIAYIISFVMNRESNGLLYGIIMFVLLFDCSKVTKYDYVYMGFLILGCIIDFVNIFYKSIHLNNIFSIIISIVVIFVFIKKKSIGYE